jgi:hypothetical protein
VIDWTTVLQGAGAVAFIGVVGIVIKAIFDERGSVMKTLMDDVQSLRAGATTFNTTFATMNDRLQTTQTSLMECRNGRDEDRREMKRQASRISELEDQVRKHTRQERPE